MCRRGFILGPLFFILYINDLPACSNELEFILLYIGVTSSILIGYKHAANSCLLCFSYVIPTDNRFYICKSDVILTDNSFMLAEVTSPTTLTSSLINFVKAGSKSRFATLSEEDLNVLLDDKDAKSIKRASKSALKVFHQYLKGKKADEPQTKDTLANVLKLFYVEARKADSTSYLKSTLSSLRFGLNRQSYSWFWHHQWFRTRHRRPKREIRRYN